MKISVFKYSDATRLFILSRREVQSLNMRKWYLQLNLIVDCRSLDWDRLESDGKSGIRYLTDTTLFNYFVAADWHSNNSWIVYFTDFSAHSKKVSVICQTKKTTAGTSVLNWDQCFALVRKIHTELFCFFNSMKSFCTSYYGWALQ